MAKKPMRPHPYTKKYSQLWKTESRRGRLPWGRAHQLVNQFQMAIPENIHTSNTVQPCQVIFRNIYVHTHTHTHMHVITISKRGHKLKGSKEEYMEGLEG